VGHLELAHDYAYEAALIDLRDIHHNSSDGLHIASLAGAWIALIGGFGGMRHHDGVLSFAPELPDGITRLRFTVHWHGLRLSVDVEPEQATYTLRDGADSSLVLRHNGEEVTVTTGKPVAQPISKRHPTLPRPPQPPGREPAHRGALGQPI
jgi:alpha,alpha-trehalose phosphorylase